MRKIKQGKGGGIGEHVHISGVCVHTVLPGTHPW